LQFYLHLFKQFQAIKKPHIMRLLVGVDGIEPPTLCL
jgi:hypothetical protein